MPNPLPETLPAPTALRPASAWVQLTGLLFIELSNWRWSWRSMLITATLAPLLSILGLGIFARDSGPDALAYVLTGNLVVSLMFGVMRSLQSHVTFLRFRGTLDYFASLPVQRAYLVLAMVIAFLLISLPSMLITLWIGAVVLDVPVRLHPLVVVIVPLAALPLAGIGAMVGASVRTPEEGGAINLVLTLLLTGLGPVVIPPDRLPVWMLSLGWLSPATYAASALRQVLIGPVTERLAVDLVVLAGFSLLAFWLVSRKLDWRIET